MITGFDEVLQVYNDAATFSSCNTVAGPFVKFPVELEGDDISAIIELHRDSLPFSDQLPSFDPPKHTAHRALLLRLITPKRLKENEEFMWQLADRQIDEFVARGECEFVHDYANPFTLLVIADLLGVPESDHETFRRQLQGDEPPDQAAWRRRRWRTSRWSSSTSGSPSTSKSSGANRAPTSCRASPPRPFPTARSPTSTTSRSIAANLFSAGGETTARLLGSAIQRLAEEPELQQLLRAERHRIPDFIEEMLRLESPIQGEFRLARVSTNVGGVDLPAGTTVMVHNGAANRDPRHFEAPERVASRPPRRPPPPRLRVRDPHVCRCTARPGRGARQPRTSSSTALTDIRISEREHGPAGARRYEYSPIYMLRGHERLHLEFTRSASG